jgi:hypothetical protein
MSDENTNLDKAPRKAAAPALKQYRITFHGEGGNVEVGHNYKLNSYPRNVECTIDENFLGVVKAAVITTTLTDNQGKETHVLVPQYSYSVEPL